MATGHLSWSEKRVHVLRRSSQPGRAYAPTRATRRVSEDALTDADFEAAFGMGRAAFAALPKFKRDNLKSKCGLYH